jgi:GT2 family glycosyltransferase
MSKKISILTLSWNGLDKLKMLQVGLAHSMEQTGAEWVWKIRDNGSKDGTVEEVSKWDNTEVLEVGHNRDNFAQGINSLATNVHADYYLLLNNDVIFGDDQSILNMLDLMEDPQVSIVGARLLYTDTNKLQHAGVIFGDRYGKMPYHYRHKEESDAQAEKNRYFQAVTAAVMLIRAKDFHAVHGMDEKYSWAFEDIDLNMKVSHQLKKKIAYCGKTKIFHEESASLKKNPVNRVFMGPNVNNFKAKWFGTYTIDHDKYLKDPNYNVIK